MLQLFKIWDYKEKEETIVFIPISAIFLFQLTAMLPYLVISKRKLFPRSEHPINELIEYFKYFIVIIFYIQMQIGVIKIDLQIRMTPKKINN